LAKSAGFCFGVKRAIDIATDTAESSSNDIYTLGPLIHNDQVVNKLKEFGVNEINEISDIPQDAEVIIRTHGVSNKVYNELKSRNIDYIDATCPFVKKIHRIVYGHYNKGYQIIIVGDTEHPEVMGINGWCKDSAIIINSPEQFANISTLEKACLVAQTTFSLEMWEKIKKIAKNSCKEVLIFDTICSATEERQNEAKIIASNVDAMLVIGGRHSSNTKKLVDICRAVCPETYHIETLSELPPAVLHKCIIGVTAGASTPEWIIKEVISKMSEEKVIENTNELSFAEELEKSLVTLKTGDIVKGTVIGITATEVYVNLGAKSDGVIPVGELSDDPAVLPEDIVKVGEEIDVFIVRVNDVEGTVLLSKKKIESIAGWKKIEGALESQEIITGKVVEAVNGGIIVLSNGVRVFVPASQASAKYIQDLNVLVGNDVSFRIIDLNPRKRKIVGSIKSVASEVLKQNLESFWTTAEIGKEYDGVVKSLTDFGAFVDIGGVDGLVHISELSWSRIKHPSEVINVGDTLKVNIIGLDKEKNKISLGYKKQTDNPWNIAEEKIHIGDVVTVKIVRLVPFGAFAEILPSVDGLIHISQISTERVEKPASVLSIGQEVQAKVTEFDLEKRKISLSIRALIEDTQEAVQVEAETVEAIETPAEAE